MKTTRKIILAGGALVVTIAFMSLRNKITNEDRQTSGSSKGFAVVELFTSEGCSSCPPADKVLERIQRDNKEGRVYILAFHVDYWDHQGWKDRFSDPEFTKRQRQYVAWLGLGTLYTPQVVVNGRSEYVGSDEGSVRKEISAGLEQQPAKELTLDCRIEKGQVHVRYDGAGNEKSSELMVALVQKSGQSNIKRGENTGRILSHVQIVRRVSSSPLNVNTKKEVILDVPNDFTENGWEVIGLVQDMSNGHIITAGRFDLDSSLPRVK